MTEKNICVNHACSTFCHTQCFDRYLKFSIIADFEGNIFFCTVSLAFVGFLESLSLFVSKSQLCFSLVLIICDSTSHFVPFLRYWISVLRKTSIYVLRPMFPEHSALGAWLPFFPANLEIWISRENSKTVAENFAEKANGRGRVRGGDFSCHGKSVYFSGSC